METARVCSSKLNLKMELSKVALMCLETSTFISWDMSLPAAPNSIERVQTQKKPVSRKIEKLYEDLRKNPDEFFSYMHMKLETFDYILEKLTPHLFCPFTKAFLPYEKLFHAIRFLVAGHSIQSHATTFQMSTSSVAKAIFPTLETIWRVLSPEHMRQPSRSEMHSLAKQYHDKWKFPNCIGAIGCKYVPVAYKSKNTIAIKNHTKRRNRKTPKSYTILNAVTDANSRFLAVDVISRENQSEDDSFKSIFHNVGVQCLPDTDIKLPLVLIGNQNYSLKKHVLRPYPLLVARARGKFNFNKRLQEARVTVDRAFEALTKKFTIFTKPLGLNLSHLTVVVKAACLMYNVVLDIDGKMDPHFSGSDDKNSSINLNLIHKSRKNNRASAIAVTIRDQFMDYFQKCEEKMILG